MRVSVAFAVLLTVAWPSLVISETLGEAAAREKARRKGKTTKVITETDIAGRGSSGPSDTTEVVGEETPAGETGETAATGETGATTEGAEGTDAPKAEGAEKAPAAAPKEKEKTPEQIRAEDEGKWKERATQLDDEIAKLKAQIAVLEGNQSMFASQSLQEQLRQAKSKLEGLQAEQTNLEEQRRRQGYRR